MRLRLRVLNVPEGEPTFAIDPPGGLLGRSAESAVCLPYESVSRQHAELQYDGKRWWLHQRSHNSLTLLDEQPLAVGATPGQLLPHGSLKLGRITLQYWQEAAAVARNTTDDLRGEVTMILPRRLSPLSIPPAVLAQMSPVRVAESAPLAAPQTMIRRPSGAVPPPPPQEAIRAKSETPMTLVLRPGVPSAVTQTQPKPLAHPLPIADHRRPEPKVAEPAPPPGPELADVCNERDRLTVEVARLRQENQELRAARDALTAQAAVPSQAVVPPAVSVAPAGASLSDKALELLLPFSRSLEQAGEALRQGDTAQARGLLRTASFALANLRDLFQP